MSKAKDLDEMLAEAAAAVEAEDATPAEGYHFVRRAAPREAGQVYSIRIPVEKLRQVRQVAELDGLQPSVMMREWVLERLEKEYLARMHACPTCGVAERQGVREAITYLKKVLGERPGTEVLDELAESLGA